ncbi:MAG: hypothetical protein ABIH92_03560 [Nanoarchaeota archaeon]
MGGYFNYAFFGVLFVVVAVLLYIFMQVSSDGLEDGTGIAVWSAIIVVFLVIGVVAISLFINKLRDKS